MNLRIRHETRYAYEDVVAYSVQSLKLTPRREPRQRTLRWQIQAPGKRVEQTDAYGNVTHLLTLDTPHREIWLVVEGEVEIDERAEYGFDAGPISPLVFLAPTALTAADARIRELGISALGGIGAATRAQAEALAAAVCKAVRYKPGATTVADTAETALSRGEGVCQDQTHLFIACCRAAGVPARYVSGYLHAGDERDIASHAWVDLWLAGESAWFGLDVTHERAAGADHCRLAVGRDYLDAAPVRGVRRGGGRETLDVSVVVERASPSPGSQPPGLQASNSQQQ
jgi:transglutaminase-like putative cysteine protease